MADENTPGRRRSPRKRGRAAAEGDPIDVPQTAGQKRKAEDALEGPKDAPPPTPRKNYRQIDTPVNIDPTVHHGNVPANNIAQQANLAPPVNAAIANLQANAVANQTQSVVATGLRDEWKVKWSWKDFPPGYLIRAPFTDTVLDPKLTKNDPVQGKFIAENALATVVSSEG